MSLRLHISMWLCMCYFVCSFCQNDSIAKSETSTAKKNIFYDAQRQKSWALGASFQTINPTGDNFFSQGYEAKNGFNIHFRLFLYKNLYIGYTGGQTDLNVINKDVLGNYDSSDYKEGFFSVGYEFLPLPKVRLGINASIYGTARFDNNTIGDEQRDTGNVRSYGISLHFKIFKNLSLFAAYDFRSTKTDIAVPQELESVFRKGTYEALNIGFRLQVGNKSAIDAM